MGKKKAYIMKNGEETVELVPLGLARHYEKIGIALIIAFLINDKLF